MLIVKEKKHDVIPLLNFVGLLFCALHRNNIFLFTPLESSLGGGGVDWCFMEKNCIPIAHKHAAIHKYASNQTC
jgi:hypothetical protein